MNYDSIDKNDLQNYKNTLEMTYAHLGEYKAGVACRIKFKNVIAKLFP